MVAPAVQEKQEKPFDDVVVTQPADPPAAAEPTWKTSNVVVASIGFLCCQVIGLPALILAMFSYVDHSNKNFAASTKKATRAKRLAAIAIVVGLLLVFLMVGWQYCTWTKKMKMKKHTMMMKGNPFHEEHMNDAKEAIGKLRMKMIKAIQEGRGEKELTKIEREIRAMRGPTMERLQPMIIKICMRLRDAMRRGKQEALNELELVDVELRRKLEEMEWRMPGKKMIVVHLIERYADLLKRAIREGRGMEKAVDRIEGEAMRNPVLRKYPNEITKRVRQVREALQAGRGEEEINKIVEEFRNWAKEE